MDYTLLNNTFNEMVDQFNYVGYHLDRSNLSVQVADAVHWFGNCENSFYNGEVICTITISQYIVSKKYEQILRNVIAHELCHAVQLFDLFNDPNWTWITPSRIEFTGGDEKDKVKLLEKFGEGPKAKDGHGQYWLDIAADITKKLKLKYPITSHIRSDLFDEIENHAKGHAVYSLVCDNCGAVAVWHWKDELDSLAVFPSEEVLILFETLILNKKDNHACAHCNGNFIPICDDATRKQLEILVGGHMLNILLTGKSGR